MPGKILNRLAVKVFVITFAVHILAGTLICAVLYYNSPMKNVTVRDRIDDMVLELNEVPCAEAGDVIDDFIETTGIDIALYHEHQIASDYSDGLVTDIGSLTLHDNVHVQAAYNRVEDPMGVCSFGISFADDDEVYTGLFFDNGKTDNIMKNSLTESIPMMVVIVLVVSLISAVIYTWLFARPIRKISRVSRAMANMELSARCDTRRGDEIGELARDLNSMAGTLQEKMTALRGEVDRVRELEGQRSMFFAAASHELKTPVTVLEGQIRGMIEGVGPYEDRDEYLARSLRTVKRMESLINEILTASRMQTDDDIGSAEVDMGEVLRARLEESADLLSVREITVDSDIADGLVFIGNRDLTSLAVGAFISNAVFYSEAGGGVKVRALRADDRITVNIRNEGARIDEADLAHLFEAFYRSDSSRSRRSGGSGLGLYLARLIIEKQGGTCALRNEDGGVVAEIILPGA